MRRWLTLIPALLLIAFCGQGIVVTPSVVYVDSTADLQLALDNARSGDIVELGPGVFTADNDSGFVIRKPVTLRGSGRGDVDGTRGTVLRPSADGDSCDAVGITIVGTDYVYIEHLGVGFGAQPADTGHGHGIHVNNHNAGAGVSMSGIYIRDVDVFYVGGHGVYYDGDGSSGVNVSACTDVNIMNVNRSGLYAYGCTGFEAHRVYAHGCGEKGIDLYGCSDARVHGCYIEGNKLRYTETQYFTADVHLTNCYGVTVYGNNFEALAPTAYATYGLQLVNCYGADIAGNQFLNETGIAGSYSIVLCQSTRGVRIGPNTHRYVARTVEVRADDGNQGIIVEPQSILSRDAVLGPGYMNISAEPDSNPVTTNHEGNFNLVYMSQTALVGADSTAGYRVVGLGLPVLNGMGNATDAEREGGITYDYVTKSFKGYNGTSWGTFGNAPTLTTAARNAATWAAGDIIINSTVDSLQVYYNPGGDGGWWNIAPVAHP